MERFNNHSRVQYYLDFFKTTARERFGIWLDRKFGTLPWLTLVGVVVGMTGGFISFFRTVLAKR